MATRRSRTRLTPFGKIVVALLAAALVIGLVWVVTAGGEDTPARSSTTPPDSPATTPVAPVPACAYGDVRAQSSGYGDWQRTLLDTEFRLPRSYRPPDLVSVSEAGFAGDFRVRSLVVDDLAALREAAANAGHPIELVAAFRSYAQQASLFERREQQLGYDRSLDKTARAGHSEHQLGTALDFKTFGAADVTESWGREPTGRWMSEHAYRFGFVLSYPDGRRNVTCYPYEPWHFRYLGRDLATRVHTTGLTLRQFLWDRTHA
ncbi:MAG TPA: M15 family metallopeptidase [Actinomycetota bacterium]|nr:M15 family metallopeptidase [Actinomycetota bacterium]